MYIKKIKRIRRDSFIKKLRNVTLYNNPDILPYKDAEIEIVISDPSCFEPSTFYVLRDGLKFVSLLTDRIASKLGDYAKINTLVEYEDEFGDVNFIAPPIIEYSDFGKWMILDGLHRCFIARHRKLSIPVALVSNATIPYPNLALPSGWKSVYIADKTPDVKRILRSGLNDLPQTRYNLHRNLSVLGSRGSRK